MRPIRILSHAALALVLFIGGVAQAAPFLPDDGGWAGDIPASVCDGVQDAGPAIQAAIRSDPSPLGIHSVRLPIGDCRISQQLISRLADGTWLANVQLYGRGAGLTTIRLMDGAVGFDNALIPKAMIYTASQVCPSCGEGAEAPTTGSWNQAFQNRIADLTIDCGANPGCIGLDFAANNAGASLRHVDFRGPGPVGISMLRKYPGPLVIEDVHIHNFAVGIDVDETEYGVTLNEIEIDGYTLAKVRNGGNSVAIRRLFGCGPQPSVLNTDPKGLVTLLESPGEQISGPGKFWRRDAGGESSSFVVQATPADLPTSLNLPIQDAPPRFESDNPADWANCTAYGVIPGATTEQGNAMIAALNSGKPIVYCPDNAYRFGKQMVIPATVKVLDMLGSGAKPTSGTNPSRLLRVETSSPDPLYIRRFAYSGSGLHQILYVSAQRLVVLEDVSAGRSSQIFVEPGAGPVIIKGGMTSQIQVGAGASVFADMLNLEGLSATGAPQYLNAGKLWALSAKYETPIARGRTLPGGCTEILGGLDYPVGAVPAGTLEHEVQEGGQAFLVYAESAYQAANEFPIALRLTRGGVVTDVLGPSLPARGAGRFAVLSAHTGACGQ